MDYTPEFYKILLAAILFIFVFLTKLLVGRTAVGKVEIMQAVIELPVGIFFLSISLLIAVIISSKMKDDAMPVFCLIICSMAISLPLVFSWRKCQSLYDSSKIRWVIFILIINFSIGITGLYYSGNRLINSAQSSKTTAISTTINKTK